MRDAIVDVLVVASWRCVSVMRAYAFRVRVRAALYLSIAKAFRFCSCLAHDP